MKFCCLIDDNFLDNFPSVGVRGIGVVSASYTLYLSTCKKIKPEYTLRHSGL